MAGDDERRPEDDGRSDGEGRVDRDRKLNGDKNHEYAKKTDTLASFEQKMAQLERKIATLESRLSDQEKSGRRTGSRSPRGGSPRPGGPRSRATSTAPTSPDTAGPKPRIRVVVSRQDIDGERIETDENSTGEAPPAKEQDNVATLWKYVWNSTGTLKVFDLGLCAMLKKLLAHYPPFNHFLGSRIEIDSPYEPLIFNWDAIVAESELQVGDEGVLRTRSDLRDLISAIRKGSGDPKLDEYFLSRNDLRREKAVTFDTLWTIFSPGTLVIGQVFLDEPQLFMVEDQRDTWPRDNDYSRRSGAPTVWELDCFMYDYTGNAFFRQNVKLPFREFTGATPILQLPYRPIEALSEKEREEILAKLLKRGRNFRDFCVARNDTRMYNYAGKAMIDHRGYRRQAGSYDADDSDSDDDRRRRRRGKASVVQRQETLSLASTNVMVDYLSYFQHGPNVRLRWSVSKLGEISVSDDVWNCMCADCQDNEGRNRLKPQYDGMNGVDDRDSWEDLQFQLCAPRVLGYVLKDKAWAQFAVSNLADIAKEDEKAVMSKLVLDGDDGGQSQKDLLLNLVKHHGMSDSSKYSLDDIVVDKGKGLVFLLYGAPGVGKTSTAQMVARAARKPLLSISVADVGVDAAAVERNLQALFDLATSWSAILLIDEADVFLQSRSKGQYGPSAEGSALVSVFLRVLEYYRGILFLTTNQIAQFDVAVQSRVHIAFKYNGLNKRQTIKIFMDFLEQLDDRGLVSDPGDIADWVKEDFYKLKFDGRQIRNIISSAMGFARGQQHTKPTTKLTKKHLKAIVENVQDFHEDLQGQMQRWQDAQAMAGIGGLK